MTSLAPRRRPFHRAGLSAAIAALLLVFAATAAAEVNAATLPDGRTVITHGVAGITPRITAGEQVELGLIDTGSEAQRDASNQTFYTPDQVVLQIPAQDTEYPGGDDPTSEIYESFAKVYDPAERYWSTPSAVHKEADEETIDWDATADRILLSLYPGANFSASLGSGINAAFRTEISSPTYSLRAVSGPGGFIAYGRDGETLPLDEGFDPLWTETDHDATWEITKGARPDANIFGTTFTEPGAYCLTFGISLPFTSGTTRTAGAAYTVVVGDLPETVPSCEQPPPDEPEDPGVLPDGRTVITQGVAGITPRITAGEQVELGLIDTGSEAQYDASNQTFYTPDQVVLQIPAQDTEYPGGTDPSSEIYESFAKVYDPAERYWSTVAAVHLQDDGDTPDWGATAGRLLLSVYTGANFHNKFGSGINAAFRNDISSPTYSLRAISGPGEFVGYMQPSEFWPLKEGFDPLWTETDHDATWEITKGARPDANIFGTTFTEPGAYCLTFGISLPFTSGTTRTAGAAYTVVVGDLPETVPSCEQPPPDEPEDPGPSPVVQYDKGHLDLRAGIKGNELTLGIDGTLVPLERVVLSGTQEGTLSPEWTEGADLGFVGEDGEPFWYFPQSIEPDEGEPTWPGFSTESIAAEQVRSTITFTLTGVSGPDRGDVALWTPGPKGFEPIFSTRLGLPMSQEYPVNAHSHNYWTFTEPGVYCLALTARAQLADGHWSSASGQLTVVAGEEVDPTAVTPCERTGDPAPEQHTYPAPHDLGSGVALYRDGNLRLVPYLEAGNLRLAAASRTVQGGPAEYREVEDVIFSDAYEDASGTWTTSGAPRVGLVPNISASATSLGLDQTAVPHVTRLTLGEVQGPGEVSVKFGDNDVIGSAEDAEKEYLIAPQGTTRGQFWTFTEAGVYCVPLTFTVTAAEGYDLSVTKVLTAVAGSEAEFPRAAITTCSRGQAPTPPGGEEPPDPEPWQVPNGWVNEAGATVLNDGHVDVASLLEGGSLITRVKDTTESASPVYRDPDETVLQILPGAETTVPADREFAFLGATGATIWQVSQTQQDDLLWPGWSTESIPAEATSGGIEWKLDSVDGPGGFFIYQTVDFGEVRRVLSSTNLSAPYTIPKITHAHGNWAFTAEGVYCLDFTRSATLTAGNSAVSDSFTLAVVVGKADPRAVDPVNCVGTKGPGPKPGEDSGSGSGTGDSPVAQPQPQPPTQPGGRLKAGAVSARTKAQAVNAKRYVPLAALSCPEGGTRCAVTTPRRIAAMIAGKRFVLTVIAPRKIRPGGKATLRLRLPKVAATRLAGHQASVRVKVVLRANGNETSRIIRVPITASGTG